MPHHACRYERQIKELKQELAMRDSLSGRSRVVYDDLTDSELRDLNLLAKKFMQVTHCDVHDSL